MKNFICAFLFIFLFASIGGDVFAQEKKHNNLTVILLRHAEKDASPTADRVNPNLSSEGNLRATRLVKKIKKYKPQAVFSSDFTRTRQTIAPLAEKRKLNVQIYNHRSLNEIRDLITSGKYKRIVVVGHNTTTPALANLLVGEERYKALTETEYDKIWVIKMKLKKNTTKAEIKTY